VDIFEFNELIVCENDSIFTYLDLFYRRFHSSIIPTLAELVRRVIIKVRHLKLIVLDGDDVIVVPVEPPPIQTHHSILVYRYTAYNL